MKKDPVDQWGQLTQPKSPTPKRLSQVVGEWEAAGESPVMIGGIPISRELTEQLRREREAES
jgi:hypothetical protein